MCTTSNWRTARIVSCKTLEEASGSLAEGLTPVGNRIEGSLQTSASLFLFDDSAAATEPGEHCEQLVEGTKVGWASRGVLVGHRRTVIAIFHL